MTVRAKLTLLNVAVLFLILIGMGMALRGRIYISMMNTLDRELASRASQLTQPRGGRPRGPGGPPGGMGDMMLGQQQGRKIQISLEMTITEMGIKIQTMTQTGIVATLDRPLMALAGHQFHQTCRFTARMALASTNGSRRPLIQN